MGGVASPLVKFSLADIFLKLLTLAGKLLTQDSGNSMPGFHFYNPWAKLATVPGRKKKHKILQTAIWCCWSFVDGLKVKVKVACSAGCVLRPTGWHGVVGFPATLAKHASSFWQAFLSCQGQVGRPHPQPHLNFRFLSIIRLWLMSTNCGLFFLSLVPRVSGWYVSRNKVNTNKTHLHHCYTLVLVF